jgi:hypothetical protein
MDIQLNFINQANDVHNSQIVIFQKNLAPDMSQFAVAWMVLKNTKRRKTVPFAFPLALEVATADSWGNESLRLPAEFGQLFQVRRSDVGDELALVGRVRSKKAILVRNGLPTGSINANLYRGGKLLATKTGIVPEQRAAFQFDPTIWIGLTAQIVEGQVMNAPTMSVAKSLSLKNVSSAEIVMTGGGKGASALPFQFTLQNIVPVG